MYLLMRFSALAFDIRRVPPPRVTSAMYSTHAASIRCGMHAHTHTLSAHARRGAFVAHWLGRTACGRGLKATTDRLVRACACCGQTRLALSTVRMPEEGRHDDMQSHRYVCVCCGVCAPLFLWYIFAAARRCRVPDKSQCGARKMSFCRCDCLRIRIDNK